VAAFTLIVFDLDGTLIDSRSDIADAANALLVSCGAEALSEEDIGRMVGEGAATLVARAFTARGLTPPLDALDRYVTLYRARQLIHTTPYPGIVDALRVLAARATLGVLTNKPLLSTREILAGLELSAFFRDDLIVGGDGPFPRKPAPAGLQHLQQRADAGAASTLLVGDSAIDLRTARAADTPICVARYGFGSAGFPFETLTPNDRVIDSPVGLLQL